MPDSNTLQCLSRLKGAIRWQNEDGLKARCSFVKVVLKRHLYEDLIYFHLTDMDLDASDWDDCFQAEDAHLLVDSLAADAETDPRFREDIIEQLGQECYRQWHEHHSQHTNLCGQMSLF